MSECTLIYPHQLFASHPAVKRGRPVAFIEDGLFFGDPHVGTKFHQQKIVLLRAAMKSYAASVEKKGHEVIYLDHDREVASEGYLEQVRRRGFQDFHVCEEADYLLERRLRRFSEGTGVRVTRYQSPMFLTPRDLLEEEFTGKRRPFMARFYEGQRRRTGILMEEDGSPTGGKWSFDEDNRKALPKKGLEIPREPRARASGVVAEAKAHVKEHYADFFGSAEGFAYPVTHRSAESWLDTFLQERFGLFGDYEDALSEKVRVAFHGVLTPMMNMGLLTPDRIIEKALAHAESHQVPLNSVEGFVRQVIGWREFMYGAYLHRGTECRLGNFWGFEDRPIPRAFYEGTTGIEPVDLVIRRVLDHGWCHHIERLMILGNFMLLCRFHPRRVYDWFMELFVDAYDWVMVPNVFGMSQFADGGIFTTKPYISGSNYVRKMSDFAKGDWCETWDGLFWTFVEDHREYFLRQHRLGMMARQLDRMAPEKLDRHRTCARRFLDSLT